jgi:phage antirepressor YoqD-like protein
MTEEIVQQSMLNESPFDSIRRFDGEGNEYWTARELMVLLGYKAWQNFQKVIEVGLENLETAVGDTTPHIIASNELPTARVPVPLQDYKLSRLACYHIALACDSRGKPEVKAAKHYFAVKTRQAENPRELTRLELLEMGLASERGRIASENARLIAESEKAALQAQIEATAPATALGQLIEGAVNDIRIGDFAKSIGMGQNRYFDQLRSDGIIQQMPSTVPYQRWINSGYFRVTQVQHQTSKGLKTFPVALITPKGQLWLARRHKREQTLVTIEAQVSAVV